MARRVIVDLISDGMFRKLCREKKVDCSTLTFKPPKDNLHYKLNVAGNFNFKSGKIYINPITIGITKKRKQIKFVVSILSHESLHKILYHTIGEKESGLPDVYLKKHDRYDATLLKYDGL